MIDVRFVGDVETFLFQQFLLHFSHTEAYAADRVGVVGYGELQMVAACADASRLGGELDAFSCEKRFGVALAERAEHLKLLYRLVAEMFERYFGINLNLGDEVFFAEMFLCISFEIGGELLDFFGRQSNTCSHSMTAEICQVL